MTAREARALAEIQRATLSLQQSTRILRDCVKVAKSNRDGLREVLDDLERLYRPERPALQVVKDDDDA